MASTRFKVGDKVRVVSERPKDCDSEPGWSPGADAYRGKDGEVIGVGEGDDILVEFPDGEWWRFAPHWLTPVTPTLVAPTRRVRIAVCIDSDGNWVASGWSGGSERQLVSSAEDYHGLLDDGAYLRVVHWVEADVPVPAAAVVEGRVATPTDGGNS